MRRTMSKPQGHDQGKAAECCAICYIKTINIREAVYVAWENKDPSFLLLYIEAMKEMKIDFDINEQNEQGVTALGTAILAPSGRLPLVKILIENGADANVPGDQGLMPLLIACAPESDGELQLIEYLIRVGKADVNARAAHQGLAALHVASQDGRGHDGDIDVVKLLLKYGADPRIETDAGATPYHLARGETIKKVLYESLRKKDKKADKLASSCAWCDVIPENQSVLKRCANCRVVMYCSKKCQAKDWKEGNHKADCAGEILLNIESYREKSIKDTVQCCSDLPDFAARLQRCSERVPSYLNNKLIVVRLDLPDLIYKGHYEEDVECVRIHNENNTVAVMIEKSDPCYRRLRALVVREGYQGQAAYFWAEVATEPVETLKIFPGKTLPLQEWT